MKKKILIGVVITITLVLISGLIYFIFTYESDKKILDNLNDEINSVENIITDDESTDEDVSENISESYNFV